MENIINQMIDCPQSYLIQYYDDLKSRLDIEYETRIREIKEAQLREGTKKQWIKLIGIIDDCLAKCINNTIPNELLNQAKEKLKDLEELELKLLCHLLSNGSCVAVLARKKQQILVVEEGLSPLEIECFLNTQLRFVKEKRSTDKFNLLQISTINDNNNFEGADSTGYVKKNTTVEIFHFESFASVRNLKLKFVSDSARRFDFDYVIDDSKFQVKCLKSFSNLKYLMIDSPPNRHCRLDLEILSNLKQLEEINIQNSDISNFDSIWFKDFTKLIKLTSFGSNLFGFKMNCLDQLTHLELNGCNIKEVTFGNMANLDSSEISDFYLRKDCFRGLTNLKQLNLTCSNISKLEENRFAGLDNLVRLDLSDNTGLTLKKGCFNGLTNLNELNLSGCNISKLEENIFAGLNNLVSLNLSYNNKLKLEKGCSNGLNNLVEINMNRCNLDNESIREVMNDLENLETLDISYNSKINLHKGLFKQLKKLKNLNISCLQWRNNDCLEGLYELENLNLSKINGILFEQSFFNQFNKLKSLNLSDCMISVLKKDCFLALNNLEKLKIDENTDIVFEEGCFNGLTQLKELDLSNCGILELRRNFFFGLDCIEFLKLGSNPDTLFADGCFNGLTNLKKLYLSSCNISELHKGFFLGLDCLEFLCLSFNRNILFADGCFDGLSQLKALYLIDCNIRWLRRNVFFGLNCLETLYLLNNPNMLLEDACFDSLKNIKVIKK